MPRMSRTIEIRAPPEEVFTYLDDIKNVGMHMASSSMAMMGGKMSSQVISKNKTGRGATYRLRGGVLWMPIDLTETVTKWTEGREKEWETVGSPKIIVMSWYRMHFVLTLAERGTHVYFEIEYELPTSLFGKILGKLLARKYAGWCLRRATEDAKLAIEQRARVA